MNSYTVKGESRSAKDCFRVTTTCLELALRADESWEVDHHVTTGIVFAAFSIEAMLNHYGKIFFSDWNAKNSCRRKDLHTKLFKAVNLPNYLGSTAYQNANKCFELRDMFAHGKTVNETVEVELPEELSHDERVGRIVGLESEAFREIELPLLRLFIDTANLIQRDIESNGFYPNQESLEPSMRSQLCECPLSVSGIRTWY